MQDKALPCDIYAEYFRLVWFHLEDKLDLLENQKSE